jgi:membrane protease YdiL (CAAX protease family)
MAYILFYLAGLVALIATRYMTTLLDVLSGLLIAGVGLAATTWITQGEGSRPGPAPRPWIGFLLVLALTITRIFKPDFVPLPVQAGLVRTALGNLLWMVLLPIAVLLLSGVPWTYLGSSNFSRGWGRWRRLVVVLGSILTLPAICQGNIIPTILSVPFHRLVVTLPLTYLYSALGVALPLEYLYRQVLQPRIEALLQRPAAAIIVQAILFGLAGAGWRIARGEPWPIALLGAAMRGSTLGLLYGLLRDRTGSLSIPLLIHAWVEMWRVLPEALN